jgi:hypothetical protein
MPFPAEHVASSLIPVGGILQAAGVHHAVQAVRPVQCRRLIRHQTPEALVDAIPDLRSLPRPTDEQYSAFARHVGGAHSWYKHLPLLTGGQFVVFSSPRSTARPSGW